MKKAWSLSTTVRNPARILPFLITLQEMEGEDFDDEGQVKFQTLLIKNKLYKPEGLSAELLSFYESDKDTMTYAQAESVFQHMVSRSKELQKSIGLRGRTSVAPLTKMGLAVAAKSDGPVVITELGKAFIDGRIDVGEIYFRFFLKWQLPTPGSNDFSDVDIYDIKPFIGTLQLIGKVNKLAEQDGLPVKGISKAEFGLFAQTLVNHVDIEAYAIEILKLRKLTQGASKTEAKNIFQNFSKQFVGKFLQTTDSHKIDALISTISDYADNTIRCFRLTRYVYIRGGGFYVDLEPRRSTEIEELLKMPANSEHFGTEEEYTEYLIDASKPKLPWQTKDKLLKIVESVQTDINSFEKTLGVTESVPTEDITQKDEKSLSAMIEEARSYRRKLQEQTNHVRSATVESLEEYIEKLQNIYSLEDRPVQLEKYTSLGLHALNDAISVSPNYPVGDDNEPTFTAPANVPDIECFYEKANSICEVTMLTSRDQWVNEGQPVMRHLRDFEVKYDEKPAYCLFIAPSLHRDTINTYWPNVKYGYEGKQQKIVPLTIQNFVSMLQTLKSLKTANKQLLHTELFGLYDQIIDLTDSTTDSVKWIEEIPTAIDKWSKQVLSK